MHHSLRYFFLVLIASALLFFIWYYINLNDPDDSEPATTKTILYWEPMFKQKDMYLGLGTKIFKGCPYSNCFATYNKSILPVEEFDAVIFHPRQTDRKFVFKFPAKRNPEQVYIILNMEAPPFTKFDFLKNYPDFFNWTMTYRRDSDVLRPYGYVEKAYKEYQLPSIESIKSRTKKIAWFVSKCVSPSKRQVLVKELNRYIPVDIYGKCGNFTCLHKDADKCDRLLEQNYKFYLSFENSICEDYITEKLYKILKLNMIPVVYGGANYREFVPEKSYIDVRDFKSVKNLADHLIFLDNNPEEYRKYFVWKKNNSVSRGVQRTLCSLCKKLNQPINRNSYHDILEWWQGKNRNKCSKANEINLLNKLF